MKILSQVKKDMEFNKGLHSLIEVLKTIAVSEFHILEQRIHTFEKFSDILEGFFELIDFRYIDHPFIHPQNRPQGIVAITSDKGLLGGLNMQIMGNALKEFDQGPSKLIVIGERGQLFVREHSISAVVFPGIQDEERYSQAMQLRSYLFNEVLKGRLGGVKIVYPRASSFTTQYVEILQLLPYARVEKKDITASVDVIRNTIWEAHPNDIVEYLLYLLMGQRIYELFGWSRLAELAARFVHLEESSHKLERLNETLKLEYFRIRHELVDRNMRELFAARSLFKHGK
jgi:ATP synthase F1 gamma subunit